VAYIFKTHVGARAHTIVVEAAVEVIKEVIKLAYQVTIKGIARCAPPPLFFIFLSPLTLPRANAELVMVRPLCQIELGISEFRDPGQDYKDGFQRGVVPRREVGHVRHHMTRGDDKRRLHKSSVTWNQARH